MLPIILKDMIRKLIKNILSFQEKEIYARIFVKFRKLMERKSFLGSSNEQK